MPVLSKQRSKFAADNILIVFLSFFIKKQLVLMFYVIIIGAYIVLDFPRDFLHFFDKGDNFCYFLCALRQTNSASEKGIHQKVWSCLFSPFLFGDPQKVIGKQCTPRSDATECGIWSGSPLFAYSLAIFLNSVSKSHGLTYLKLKFKVCVWVWGGGGGERVYSD